MSRTDDSAATGSRRPGRSARLLATLVAVTLFGLTATLGGLPVVAQDASPAAASTFLMQDPAAPCPAPDADGSGSDAATLDADADGQRPVYDYAILVDTSGSMINDYNGDLIPDEIIQSPNIFADVQRAVVTFVDDLPEGSNVVIIPFGNPVDPANIQTFSFDDAGQRDAARAYVQGLLPDDGLTQITDAVTVALDQLAALQSGSDRTHVQTILLYTDGLGTGDTDRGPDGQPSVDTLLERLDAARTDQQFLFVKYVALGVDVPLRDQLEGSGIVTVFEEEPGVVSDVREIRLAIPGNDLGTIQPGQPYQLRLCALSGDLGNGAPVTLSLNQGGLGDDFSAAIAPNAGTIGSDGLLLELTVARAFGRTAGGAYEVEVAIASDDPLVFPVPNVLPIRFAVDEVTPTPTPSPTATNTPMPTATATPTNTPTPTATATFTPTPSPTPTPTAAPAVEVDLDLPIDFGSVSVDGAAPTGTVEWRTQLPLLFVDGAEANARFEDGITAGGAAVEGAAGSFVLGDNPGRESLNLRDGQSAVAAVLRIPAASLVTLQDGSHPITGAILVAVSPQDAAFLPVDAERLEDGTYRLPFVATAAVTIPTPTPLPTATPTPTPTPVPGAQIDIGPWTKPEVSTTGDPEAVVEWVAPISATVEPGAHPSVDFVLDSGDPPMQPEPNVRFRTEAGNLSERPVVLDGDQPGLQVVVSAQAGAIQQLGDGDDHAIGGALVVDPKGADISVPGGVAQEDGSIVKPAPLPAKVFTPIDWMALIRQFLPFALGGLAALAAILAALWAMPGLPKHAAVVDTFGTRHPVTRGGTSVGGPGDDISLGFPQTVGTISGGMFKRARFTAAHDGVEIDGNPLDEGKSTTLSDGASIEANRMSFEFTTTKPTADGADGFDGN